jgi:hypothetical protein
VMPCSLRLSAPQPSFLVCRENYTAHA